MNLIEIFNLNAIDVSTLNLDEDLAYKYEKIRYEMDAYYEIFRKTTGGLRHKMAHKMIRLSEELQDLRERMGQKL